MDMPSPSTSSITPAADAGADPDAKLNGLLERLQSVAERPQMPPTSTPASSPQSRYHSEAMVDSHGFETSPPAFPQDVRNEPPASKPALPKMGADVYIPREPTSLQSAGITESEVESLILKFLLARGNCTGHGIADQVRLPFIIVEPTLLRMKQERVVAYRDSAPMGDYIYELSDLGRERGRRYNEVCTYFGSAPVSLDEYAEGVKAQTMEGQRPSQQDLEKAFHDLLINPTMFDRLGPAIASGRGMFLFGFPGNGKTSIAERVTRAFGSTIWIPRALSADGHIIRLFDPMLHEESPPGRNEGLLDESSIDGRWIRIKRPTIVVGGELTMDMLEVRLNKSTGTSEASLQLKSNCGTLVIDDLGRQKMSVDELLNRWIVPLEKRYDFLNISTGKKLEVPFDQLVVFSTNLEPRDLVDDAFLRRIPYKIEVKDPTEPEFRHMFRTMCESLDIEYTEKAVDYLINKHYQPKSRPFRCCHPRDLLFQVRNYCLYKKRDVELRPEYLDYAVETYFSVM